MKTSAFMKKGSLILLCFVSLLLCGYDAALARSGGWENMVKIYGWYAGIDGTARFPDASGGNIEVEASDVIDNLEFAMMAQYEGGIDRWRMIVDVVYLDVGSSGDVDTRAGLANVDLGIISWLVNAGVGYDFVQSDKAVAGLVGGVRYLSLDIDVDATLQSGLRLTNPSRSESITDGFVGFKGQVMFNDHWFLPYYADIGTGGSDYSYQLFAGIGYKFGWGNIELGYRHIYFELDDGKVMDSLQVSGPLLGVGFRF